MNTELLKRLQDLQEGITLISGPQGELRKAADECIKLAKLSYFEGRVKGGDQPKEPVAWQERLKLCEDAIREHPVLSELIAHFIRNGMVATLMPLEEFYRRARSLEYNAAAHPPKDQPKALTVDEFVKSMKEGQMVIVPPVDTDKLIDQLMHIINSDTAINGPFTEFASDALESELMDKVREIARKALAAISPSTDTDKLIEAGDSAFALWLAEIKDDGFDESTRYNVAKAAWDAATSKDVGE